MNKKICFFHPSSDLYGSDKILLNVIQCLDDFTITVFLRTRGPLVDYLLKEPNVNVEIIDFPILAKKNFTIKGCFNLLLSMFRFYRFTSQESLSEFSVIYLNTIATVPILLFLKNARNILHLHEVIDVAQFLYRFVAKFILAHASQIICVSKAVATPFITLNKKKSLSIEVIHNGIPDNNKLLSSDRSSNKVVFALLGRIKPIMKGQNFMIDAVRNLSELEKNKAKFLIVGSAVSGQEYMVDDLRKYISEMNLDNFITIIPFIEDISLIYNQADVILVPSLCEDSFPTTVLEAMSFGKPVIATLSGGIPEMLEHNETGILINKYDVEAFTAAIRYLLVHPDKRLDMGLNAKSQFEKCFTLQQFRLNIRNILDEKQN